MVGHHAVVLRIIDSGPNRQGDALPSHALQREGMAAWRNEFATRSGNRKSLSRRRMGSDIRRQHKRSGERRRRIDLRTAFWCRNQLEFAAPYGLLQRDNKSWIGGIG